MKLPLWIALMLGLSREVRNPPPETVTLDLPAPAGPCLTLYLVRDPGFAAGVVPAEGAVTGGVSCGVVDMAGVPLAYFVAREAVVAQSISCEVGGLLIEARLRDPSSKPSQAAWRFEYAEPPGSAQCTRTEIRLAPRSPPVPEPLPPR